MGSRFIRGATVLAGVGALAIPLAAGVAHADVRADVPGTQPGWASPQHAAATPAASDTVSFSVSLQLRNAKSAERYATDVSTPGSNVYGKFLSPKEFNARYAPGDAQVDRVRSFLKSQGIHVDGVAPGNRWVQATGTVSQVDKAFGTLLKTYSWKGKQLKAPSSKVSVPSSVSGDILTVTGLDQSTSLRRPASRRISPEQTGGVTARAAAAATPPAPSKCSTFWAQNYQTVPAAYGKTTFPTYICGYNPDQLQSAYEVKPAIANGQDGHGVTVAIIDAYGSPTMAADADAYATTFGQPKFTAGQYTETLFTPFQLQDTCGGEPGWNGEESLDVEAVHALAPGAKIRYVGARDCDQGIDEAINYVVQNKVADIVSNSYGNPGEDLPASELAKEHSLLVQAAAEGIGFHFSSGDEGDEVTAGKTTSAQPDYPASDPFATAVGGTSLAIDSGNGYQFETGWGSDVARVNYTGPTAAYSAPVPGTFAFGAGGGTSTVFDQPAYQKNKVPASLSRQFGGAAKRVSPDVAAVADPYTGFAIGQTVNGQFTISGIGGTSLACPVFAGIEALASTGRKGPIGFANPLLYGLRSAVFHDVVPQRVPVAVATPSGSALITFDRDSTLATSFGYDDVTGLGSPHGTDYLRAIRNGR